MLRKCEAISKSEKGFRLENWVGDEVCGVAKLFRRSNERPGTESRRSGRRSSGSRQQVRIDWTHKKDGRCLKLEAGRVFGGSLVVDVPAESVMTRKDVRGLAGGAERVSLELG